MSRPNKTRAKNVIVLLGILFGGVMTNCDSCADVDVTGSHRPAIPADGTSEPVPGCDPPQRYLAYDTLRSPEQCDGANAGGQELKANPHHLALCPDAHSFAANDEFRLYWTICNTAASVPPTVLPYELKVSRVSAGEEVELRSFPLSQPSLAACDCSTQVVVFNSPSDPEVQRKLGVGSYRFRLTGPYTSIAYEQADVVQ